MTELKPVWHHQTNDPTQTLALRRRYMAEFRRRWRLVLRLLRETIVKNDALRLRPPDILIAMQDVPDAERDFGFTSDSQKLALFGIWLRQVIDTAVLGIRARPADGTVDHEDWQARFIRPAYFRGIVLANRDVVDLGGDLAARVGDVTSTEQMLDPANLAIVAALTQQYFNDLTGVADETIKQIQRILATALLVGMTPEEVMDAVEARIESIGQVRSDSLANVAVVDSVNRGILKRFEQIGIVLVGLQIELAFWQTAEDDRVCIRCQQGTTQDNGFGPGVYTIQQAAGLLPVHIRCRCRWRPVLLPEVALTQLVANDDARIALWQ